MKTLIGSRKEPLVIFLRIFTHKYASMKNIFLILISVCVLFCCAFMSNSSQENQQTEVLTWYTWEQAVELQKSAPKKVMVDMYTDWCGWCKRMDQTTFSDPEVVKYIQANFYPVKFNAEQRDSIKFRDYTFKYIAPQNGGGRGVHELAYSLLDGKLGYPSIVYLTSDYARILTSPGYKDTNGMLTELKFVQDDVYKTKSFEDYKAGK